MTSENFASRSPLSQLQRTKDPEDAAWIAYHHLNMCFGHQLRPGKTRAALHKRAAHRLVGLPDLIDIPIDHRAVEKTQRKVIFAGIAWIAILRDSDSKPLVVFHEERIRRRQQGRVLRIQQIETLPQVNVRSEHRWMVHRA